MVKIWDLEMCFSYSKVNDSYVGPFHPKLCFVFNWTPTSRPLDMKPSLHKKKKKKINFMLFCTVLLSLIFLLFNLFHWVSFSKIIRFMATFMKQVQVFNRLCGIEVLKKGLWPQYETQIETAFYCKYSLFSFLLKIKRTLYNIFSHFLSN